MVVSLEVDDEIAKKCMLATGCLKIPFYRASDLNEVRQRICIDQLICLVVPAISAHLITISKQEHTDFRCLGKVLIDEEQRIDFLRNVGWPAFSPFANIEEISFEIESAILQAVSQKRSWKEFYDFKQKLGLLSDDEILVLEEVLRGRLNKQIASKLDVSIRTIEQRRHRIFSKMEVSSAVPLAMQFATYKQLSRQLYRLDGSHSNDNLDAAKFEEFQNVISKLRNEMQTE